MIEKGSLYHSDYLDCNVLVLDYGFNKEYIKVLTPKAGLLTIAPRQLNKLLAKKLKFKNKQTFFDMVRQ